MKESIVVGRKALSIPGGIAVGLVVCITWLACTSCILAKLMEKNTISGNAIGYTIMSMLLIGSFAGARLSIKQTCRRAAMVCLLFVTSLIIVLMGSTLLFFGGDFGGLLPTVSIITCGGGLALVSSSKKSYGKNRWNKKAEHR